MGYDGRGQRVVDSTAALAAAWRELGGVPSIAEAFVEFDREVSLIGVQGARGERVFYPLAENVHHGGILASTLAPYEDQALQQQAERWLTAIMATLQYRGVLTVEFFHTKEGLVANEMAPRVHNSGHWTIEGAATSQFENHLRAVLGWPLGDASARGHAAMLNLLGRLPPRDTVLCISGAHLHDYGKSPRPGRKVGHCTLVDSCAPGYSSAWTRCGTWFFGPISDSAPRNTVGLWGSLQTFVEGPSDRNRQCTASYSN